MIKNYSNRFRAQNEYVLWVINQLSCPVGSCAHFAVKIGPERVKISNPSWIVRNLRNLLKSEKTSIIIMMQPQNSTKCLLKETKKHCLREVEWRQESAVVFYGIAEMVCEIPCRVDASQTGHPHINKSMRIPQICVLVRISCKTVISKAKPVECTATSNASSCPHLLIFLTSLFTADRKSVV